MTGQQTLCFTQTRKKTSENDASLPTVIDDTGETSDSEGREKGPGDQVLEDVRYQSESKSVPDKNTKQMTQTQSQMTSKQIATVMKWKSLHKWLEFDKNNQVMTCTICKKAGVKNAMTKGCANFKSSALSDHLDGKGPQSHKAALAVPEEQENNKKCHDKNTSDTKKRVLARMKIVRWLAKEGLPFV